MLSGTRIAENCKATAGIYTARYMAKTCKTIQYLVLVTATPMKKWRYYKEP
jgi:hypothetical protein